ncbi:PaaI family thioesterase [Undibacterium sp. RuTC16W]|uniref:PaaI family thioesterase n=1 Tax=Undibacterium sp. RuTC16W TaxID=3413048 RepID=UPI003BEF50A9
MDQPTTPAALDHKLAFMLLESFNKQGALTSWDARLTSMTPGACEIIVPMSNKVSQQHGYFHGGVMGALADAAGGYAANTLLMPVSECLTAEYKINIMSPGIGDTLIARGKVVKAGKTLVVSSAELFVVSLGKEKLCAVMQQTLFVIPRENS